MTDSHQARRNRINELGFDYEAQPKQAVRDCNLCGYRRFVVLAHRDRYGFPVQAHGCLQCGLVFLNPSMTADAYRGFYEDVYRPLVSAYHCRRIDAQTIQAEQRSYADERADLLAPYVSCRGYATLLDIGGSTGIVAHSWGQRFGLRAAVLDPAPLEIEQAQKLGLETVTGFLADYDSADRRFDVVAMCQTIDHLQDIAEAMRQIRALLSADGLLFVDILDFRAVYLRHWSVEEAIKVDHPFYLTEATMRAYLQRFGFEVLRVDYAPDHLHVGYVCGVTQPVTDALPPERVVESLWGEIRLVQNAPRS